MKRRGSSLFLWTELMKVDRLSRAHRLAPIRRIQVLKNIINNLNGSHTEKGQFLKHVSLAVFEQRNCVIECAG